MEMPQAGDGTPDLITWLLYAILIAVFLIVAFKAYALYQEIFIEWRHENKNARFFLQNISLATNKELLEEKKLIEDGIHFYSRRLTIELYIAIRQELDSRKI